MRFTVKKTLQIALAHEAHVLVQVKSNQIRLFELCQLLPACYNATEQHQNHYRSHGRDEQRTVDTYHPPHWWLPTDWNDLVKTVIRVRRTRRHRRQGRWETSEETSWWISTAEMTASACAKAIRGHWQIENQLHHVRDVALQEDANQTRIRPGTLARFRSMALNCLRFKKVPSISRALYRNALNFKLLAAMVNL